MIWSPKEVLLQKYLEVMLKKSPTLTEKFSTFALKSELSSEIGRVESSLSNQITTKADATALSAYLTNERANSIFQPKGDYVTREQLGGLSELDLSNYQPKGDYATKSDLITKVNVSDMANYALKTDLNAKADVTALSDLATKSELNSKANSADLINYATKEQLNLKADSSELANLQPRGNYATKEQLGLKADLTELAKYQLKGNYATKEDLDLKADATLIAGLQPKGDYATKAELNSKADATDLNNYQLAGDYATNSDLGLRVGATLQSAKDYADKIKNDLIGGADSAYDTLKEIETLMKSDGQQLQTLINSMGQKASKFSATIGDGVSNKVTVTHNLNTTEIAPAIWTNTSPASLYIADIEIIDNNSVSVDFGTYIGGKGDEAPFIPNENQFKIVIVG